MTVQELIDELLKVEDKSKIVAIRDVNNWGWDSVSHIDEEDPSSGNKYVIIMRE